MATMIQYADAWGGELKKMSHAAKSFLEAKNNILAAHTCSLVVE